MHQFREDPQLEPIVAPAGEGQVLFAQAEEFLIRPVPLVAFGLLPQVVSQLSSLV